jgi:hypothetical protein
MNGNVTIGFPSPVEAYAQVVIYITHEVNFDSRSKFLFKVLFHCWVLGEIYQVVHIERKVQWGSAWDEVSNEQAIFMCGRM